MATDIDPKIVRASVELLSKVVKKPVVTEKLVKRPPFRFLHDLIISIVKTHGFLKDLYTETEMIAENVKEKEAKIAFLQKAIDATGFVVGDVLNVKPSKIVAGLEADRTNDWLQTMAKAVIEKRSSGEAVRRVLDGEKPSKQVVTSNGTTKTDKTAANKTNTNTTKKKATNESIKTTNNRNMKTKRETNETKSEQKKQTIKETKESKESKEAKESKAETKAANDAIVAQPRPSPVLSANSANQISSQMEPELSANGLNGNTSKPSSASEDAPKVDKRDDDTNDQFVNKEGEDRHNGSANNEEAIVQKPLPALDQPQTVRPKNSARPPVPVNAVQSSGVETNRSVRPPTRHERAGRSARPSSSRPAPPRLVAKANEENKLAEAQLEEKLKLLNAKPVENLIPENNTNEEDQDFIVSNVVKSEEMDASDRLDSYGGSEQKGSLVKQLVDTKKELEGSQSSEAPKEEKKLIRQTNRDIEKLRQTIQALSQTANPLGKVLDYLQEDIDSMLSELRSWQEEYKRNVQSLDRSRNATLATLEPFRDELNLLDNDISDQMERISVTKANIIRNEERLQKMVQMVNRI